MRFVVLNNKNVSYLDLSGGLHITSSKLDYANYDQFAPNFDMRP